MKKTNHNDIENYRYKKNGILMVGGPSMPKKPTFPIDLGKEHRRVKAAGW